ncbi:MAG: adenosylcobinamide-GDP ribazoletransferase [Firmicutes bacterium]|nr:adenosylcobinamide-GDP ribazoletransferase [Bacillota bacterium]
MIHSFLLMLGFFTRIPVPQIEYTEERYVRGIPLLPFVGAVTGGILACIWQLNRWLPMPAVSLLMFLAYLLITGGIHLDGLGDSCDALFSGRDREKMLEIMKDSRSGSFGVLGLVFASAAYLILLNYASWQAVLLFPIIGKCTPALASNVSPYIRAKGMAELFCKNATGGVLVFDLALCLAAAFLLQIPLGIAAILSLFVGTLLTLRVKHILGGITGDILGLVCEVTQLAFLFFCLIRYR